MQSHGRNPTSSKRTVQIKLEGIQKSMNAVSSQIKHLYPSPSDLLALTQLSVKDLAGKLRRSDLNPKQVVHAFSLKCVELHEQGNSGICELISWAEQQVDAIATSSDEDNELRGIPVSLDEAYCVHGYDSTLGLLKFCNQPSTEDCVLIKALRAIGAVPFALTTTSQGAMTLSGFNPVFGDVFNPNTSRQHEPGGSCCGAAVLIKKRGAPIGFGIDVAGNIRIPCAFCGVCGLKPTVSRMSNQGVKQLQSTAMLLTIAVGPMGRQVSDLVAPMRGLLREELFQLDPTIPPMRFDDRIYFGVDKPRLRIGFYDRIDDPHIMQSVPSVRRALREAADILKQKGHNVVPFSPPEPHKALQLAIQALALDGGNGAADILHGEPLNQHSKASKHLNVVPEILRGLLDRGIQKFIGQPAAVTNMLKKLSTCEQVMTLEEKIQNYRRLFADSWIQEHNLDAVICPVWSTPAPELSAPVYFISPAIMYTLLYNLLDYPAGTVPMGSVNSCDIEQSEKLKTTFKIAGDLYSAKLMQMQAQTCGLPLSVQVVGLPFREELVLRVMEELESGRKIEEPPKDVHV